MGLNNKSSAKDITIIGAAIIDVLAGPVSEELFHVNSQAMDEILLSFGGDALNEAAALSKLGKKADLITVLGEDEAGKRVLGYLQEKGIGTDKIKITPGLMTGINIVLIDSRGERHFLTNPRGSLRTLPEEILLPRLDDIGDIVSFASLFVALDLDIPAMERIFKKIKEKKDRILVVDMTFPKHGETLEDIRCLLPYIDYFLPNESEIDSLTKDPDPYRNAETLVQNGLHCAVIKLGKKGCLIRTKEDTLEIPAYPLAQAVDTTGAGDSFAAGFLWGLSQGLPLYDCGCYANASASCSVEQTGATEGIRSLEEVQRRYRLIRQR